MAIARSVSTARCALTVLSLRREARAQRTAQVVTDPVATRVFHPDGAITVYARDGSVVRVEPGSAYALPSSMRRPVTP